MSAELIQLPRLDARLLELGARVRFLRKQAGLSPADAAERLDIEVGMLVRIEHGGAGLMPEQVREICRRFGGDGGGAA